MPVLTAEMVVDWRVPATPSVSPDGRWVAFVVAPLGVVDGSPRRELWLAAVDGATPPRRLAAGTEPRWSADSASVFFLADGQVHVLARDGGPAEAVTAWPAGVLGYRPLTEPDLVVFVAESEPPEAEVLVRGNPAPARLWLLDRRTNEVRALGAFGDRHVVEVAPRPDGGPLAVLTWSSAEHDPGSLHPAVHTVDVATGEVRELGATPAGAESLAWWRDTDGWHLAYLALTPPGLQAGAAVFAVSPAGAHRNTTEGSPWCPVELVQVDGGAPLVLVADGLDTAIHRLGTEVTRFTGLARQLSASGDGQVVAAVLSGPGAPHTVHAGLLGEPLVPCADTCPELRAVTWGEQRRLSYRADDGLELDGILVLPPGEDGPFPLITVPHGGPYDRYADQFMLHWVPFGQWLAHAGYAVFLPNPRGGQGHGHAFAVTVAGALGQAEWTDILTGIDLLVAEGVADPDRLGIAGWSHGGFLAAWAVSQTDRFAAALVGAGISDWGMQAALGELGVWEAALGGTVGWEGPGPHPHDQVSPISYASAIRTPVLIVHGAEDTNVPVAQAEFLHRALRHFGVEHEFVVYPREGHSVRERAHQLDLLHRTRAWFDRWLR